MKTCNKCPYFKSLSFFGIEEFTAMCRHPKWGKASNNEVKRKKICEYTVEDVMTPEWCPLNVKEIIYAPPVFVWFPLESEPSLTENV